MPLENLFRPAQTLGWMPDADSVNAPHGALLRADNLTVDEKGALALRKGSSLIYSGLQDTSVDTINTYYLTGFNTNSAGTYRINGVNQKLYINGTYRNITFNGTGDVACGTDSYQSFMANGTVKKKFDGATLNNWGIAAPSTAPTLTAATALTSVAASFDSTENPALVVNEGAGAFINGYDGTVNGALQITPVAATGRASVSKAYATDTDFYNILGVTGSDTDMFDIFISLAEPTKVQKVTAMFGLGTGSDPFATDFYSFEFDIGNDISTNVKDPTSYTSTIAQAYANVTTPALTPQQITGVQNPLEVRNSLTQKQATTGRPRANTRKDSSHNSGPAWAHLSVTRGQFDRTGSTSGRGWTTVKGFKIVYQAIAGSTDVVRFDSAIWYGGGERALTGTYTVGYRFVRDTGQYQELSPLSPISNPITLNQQGISITIPAAALAGADTQVNQIWIYIYGGFLDTFYRAAITGNNANSSSMTLDEFAPSPNSNNLNTAADRTRKSSLGFTIPGFTANADLSVSLLKSEVTILTENEQLEPGAILPPDNIVAIEGPIASRIFALTSDGWLYISGQRRPSTFSAYWALDLRQWGTPYWMKKGLGGLYVGMSQDIIFIQGTFDESADHTQIDAIPIPQNVGNPPIDQAVCVDRNTIIYLAPDGLMAMTGNQVEPLSKGVTTLLWRGFTRHGVQPLNLTTGRFRLAIDNHILYMLAPEGTNTDTNVIWRFYNDTWYRTTYSNNFRCITREPDGSLVAGDNIGNVWLLENGTQDNGNNITVYLLTPIDDGGSPLNRKDPFDIQLHIDTGGRAASIQLTPEGTSGNGAAFTTTTSTPTVYRINATSVNTFLKMQMSISGTFFKFVLQAFNLTYRKRPQQVMVVDTGAIKPSEPRRWSWLRQVEVDCISPSNLTLETYIDDVLKNSSTITVTANKRSTYRVSLPRGIAGTTPRLLVKTTANDAVGNVGFEPYAIRLRAFEAGNESDRNFTTVWATGEQLV